MLSTMLLAEQVARGDLDALELVRDEQGRAVTQTLVIAQQCAVEQLEHDEDEVEKEDDTDRLPLVETTPKRGYNTHRRKSKGRLIRMFSGLSVVTDLPSPQRVPATRAQRASIWLDDILVASGGSEDPHPGKRRQKRLSSAGTANAPVELLRKWTDQQDTSPVFQPQPPRKTFTASSDMWRDSTFTFATDEPQATKPGARQLDGHEIRGITRATTDIISPKTGRVQSISFHKVVGFEGSIEYSTDVANFDYEKDVDTDSIKRSMMEDYGLLGQIDQVTLCIYFGGKTRVLKRSDRPLEVLRQYEDMEMEPRLFLRHG